MRKELTVTVDAWGNIIVAGRVDPSSTESFVAKLDKDGQLLWHRGLQPADSARTSSMPPPMAHLGDGAPATETVRDSVEPQLLEVDRYERQLTRRSSGRVIGGALAALVVCGVVGAALGTSWLDSEPGSLEPQVLRKAEMTLTAEMAPAGTTEAAQPVAPVEMPMPSAEQLREETLALLTSGLPAQALPVARAYVGAAPHHAMSYLFLGATLQELGRVNEAREIYNDCVKLSDEGDISECYALGGRK